MGWVYGDTVTVRDIRQGVVYFAWPLRVVGTDGGRYLLAQRPGAVGKVLRGYPSEPEAILAQLRSGRPELVDLAWTRTVTLSIWEEGSRWVPRLFWDAGTGEFLCYYVDFVRPVAFRPATVDTSDLELDIVSFPDRKWFYKDQGSYEHLREIGWVSPDDHEAIEATKPIVIDAIEAARFPFDGSLLDWRWPEELRPASLGDAGPDDLDVGP